MRGRTRSDRGPFFCVAGFALMRIVEVYKEIQEQEMNIVSET